MYRAIPAEEIGWENPAHHMQYNEWRKYLHRRINCEFKFDRRDRSEVNLYSYIMYLDKYPIGLIHMSVYHKNQKLTGLADIGYVIRPVCRGTGLGITILSLLIGEAKGSGVTKLRGHANKYNPASCKTMESCGFKFIRNTEQGSKEYVLEL
jgi:predicted acetyltransferase